MQIKKNLENYFKKEITQENYIQALQMATQDIKANKIYYNRTTPFRETEKIIQMCYMVAERCQL